MDESLLPLLEARMTRLVGITPRSTTTKIHRDDPEVEALWMEGGWVWCQTSGGVFGWPPGQVERVEMYAGGPPGEGDE